MSLGPRISHEEAFLDLKWGEFYSNLLNDLRGQNRYYENAPGLEKLIDFLDEFRNPSENPKFMIEDIQEPINDNRIFSHFNKLLDYYDVQKNDNKELWNFSSDLLRSLKRIKNDEAKFQMPYSEWKVAYEFINMMKSPPWDSGSAWQVY